MLSYVNTYNLLIFNRRRAQKKSEIHLKTIWKPRRARAGRSIEVTFSGLFRPDKSVEVCYEDVCKGPRARRGWVPDSTILPFSIRARWCLVQLHNVFGAARAAEFAMIEVFQDCLRKFYVDFWIDSIVVWKSISIFAASEDNRQRWGATCERMTAVLQGTWARRRETSPRSLFLRVRT